MKIIRAPHLGFCQGVRRAYNLVLELIKNSNDKPIVILGELVHNREVMTDLTRRGIKVVIDYKNVHDSIVITRTHGISKTILETIKSNKNEIKDLTCSIVQNLRTVASQLFEDENVDCIVIIGHPDHAEVVATQSWIDNCYTVSNEADVDLLPTVKSVGVVAQTTFSQDLFKVICSKIKERFEHVIVRNTICPHTARNQETSKDLAAGVDFVVVVGDVASSNTRTMLNACLSVNPKTFLVCNVKELDLIPNLNTFKTVLLTAGASAPDWIINQIEQALEKS